MTASDTKTFETEMNFENIRKYAWDYFQMHSTQRIATFNFYISLATAILVAICAVLQPSINLPFVSGALSLTLCFISFVFWKLDVRSKQLIKTSEEALKEIENILEEKNSKSKPFSLFSIDAAFVKEKKSHKSIFFWKNHYSYSNCFNLIFGIFVVFGLTGLLFTLIN